jgi:hypothetical protein
VPMGGSASAAAEDANRKKSASQVVRKDFIAQPPVSFAQYKPHCSPRKSSCDVSDGLIPFALFAVLPRRG